MQTWKYDEWGPGILTVFWERQFDFFAFHCYPSASATVDSKKLSRGCFNQNGIVKVYVHDFEHFT